MTDTPDLPGAPWGATLLMADSAQVANGKLFLLGGGISELPPNPQPFAVAVILEVPWEEAGKPHTWMLELLDADANPVMAGQGGEERPLIVQGTIEIQRAPSAMAGAPLRASIAVNFGMLAIPPGRLYLWRLAVDGTSEPDWTLGFGIRAPQPPPDAPQPPA